MGEDKKIINIKPVEVKTPLSDSEPKTITISAKWKKVPMFLVPAKDAKQFGKNQQNRNIDAKHVAKIKKDYVESIPYLPPITVNINTGNIIDGQHRLQAFFDLIEEGKLKESETILTRFVDVQEEDEKNVIVNSNTKVKVWNQNDYINSYTTVNDNYSQLTQWCLNHRLCHNEGKPLYRYASAIITGKNSGTILKKGEFKLTDEEMAKAEDNYNEVNSIIENTHLPSSGSYIESLAIAWFTHKNWLLKGFGGMDNFLAYLNKEKMYIWSRPHTSKAHWEHLFAELYDKASGKTIMYDKALKNEKYPFKFVIVDRNGNDGVFEVKEELEATDENIIIPNIEDVIRTDE